MRQGSSFLLLAVGGPEREAVGNRFWAIPGLAGKGGVRSDPLVGKIKMSDSGPRHRDHKRGLDLWEKI